MTANSDPRQPSPWEYAGAFLLLAVLTLWALFSVSSCSPRIYERVVYQRDTTYINKVQVDSVYKCDSVLVREKGDTVYIYKERIREKYKLIRDTVRLVKVDSVAVERIKEVEMEKPLTAIQSLKLRGFWPLLGLVVLLLAWTFRKPLLKLLKI